jgi:hypothetical protein
MAPRRKAGIGSLESPTSKTLSLTIEEHGGGVAVVTLLPGRGVDSKDMLEGMVGGLAAVWAATWGDSDEDEDDYLTHEEFAQLIANRIFSRLENYNVRSDILQ